LRDCRKSLKRTILAILHVMKSISYEYQKHKFRVFRQSLQLSKDGIILKRLGKITPISDIVEKVEIGIRS
jgi:hypothetical protein